MHPSPRTRPRECIPGALGIKEPRSSRDAFPRTCLGRGCRSFTADALPSCAALGLLPQQLQELVLRDPAAGEEDDAKLARRPSQVQIPGLVPEGDSELVGGDHSRLERHVAEEKFRIDSITHDAASRVPSAL